MHTYTCTFLSLSLPFPFSFSFSLCVYVIQFHEIDFACYLQSTKKMHPKQHLSFEFIQQLDIFIPFSQQPLTPSIHFNRTLPFIWCRVSYLMFVAFSWHQFGHIFLIKLFRKVMEYIYTPFSFEIKCQTTISCSELRIILLFYVPI